MIFATYFYHNTDLKHETFEYETSQTNYVGVISRQYKINCVLQIISNVSSYHFLMKNVWLSAL